MRKRNIKSIAHWSIMSVLLLFPVLMVGISAFANDEQATTVNESYQYATNEVSSFDDVNLGNIYKVSHYNFTYGEHLFIEGRLIMLDYSSYNLNGENINDDYAVYFDDTNFTSYFTFTYDNTFMNINYGGISIDTQNDYFDIELLDCYLVISGFEYGSATPYHTIFSASDYLGEKTTIVDIQESNYKQEVNNWANGFKQLPVNSWYNSLLNAIGIGDTTNSVMNVIYVYPLYVLWVYILDLIVDCLLLIINFGHDALQRLGADNE